MAKYRKKPVVIEAQQVSWENAASVASWCAGTVSDSGFVPSGGMWVTISIPTLEGTMKANLGDFVIRGVKGEFYPCKPDIFEATYEKVETE